MKIVKTVKVQQSKMNTRVEIPTIFVESLNIQKGDSFIWSFEDGRLIGEPEEKAMHTLKVKFNDGDERIVSLDAPNQRDAKKIAKKEACAEKYAGDISEEKIATIVDVKYAR